MNRRRDRGHREPGGEVHALPARPAQPGHRDRAAAVRPARARRARGDRGGLRVARLDRVRPGREPAAHDQGRHGGHRRGPADEDRRRARRQRPARARRAARGRHPGGPRRHGGAGAGAAGGRARPGDHPRQRPAGRDAGAGERARPGHRPALPVRRAGRADPGHDRLLAAPGAAERAARPPGGLPGQPDPGPPGRPGLRAPVQVRRPGLRRGAGPGPGREPHWEIRQDGARWRRVVPSPEPAELLDLPAIRTLLGTGAIVVCAGGGGVPVVVTDGRARAAWRRWSTRT